MRRRLPFLAGLLAFAAISAAAVWGALYLAAPVSFERDGATPAHALRVEGNLVLCNLTELDGSGGIRPHVVSTFAPSGQKRDLTVNLRCDIPGFEFQYCKNRHGFVGWMVPAPRFLPIACIVVAVFAWKWRCRQLRLAETDPRQPPPDP